MNCYCGNPLPDVGIRNDDPYCSRECAVKAFGGDPKGPRVLPLRTMLDGPAPATLPMQQEAKKRDARAREVLKKGPLRVVVCGSRGWVDSEMIKRHLELLHADCEIVVGDARGADAMAFDIARELGFRPRLFAAEWKRYGKVAGMIRNIDMLATDPDLVLAFWDGASNGTMHTVKTARRMEIPVRLLRDEEEEKRRAKALREENGERADGD